MFRKVAISSNTLWFQTIGYLDRWRLQFTGYGPRVSYRERRKPRGIVKRATVDIFFHDIFLHDATASHYPTTDFAEIHQHSELLSVVCKYLFTFLLGFSINFNF